MTKITCAGIKDLFLPEEIPVYSPLKSDADPVDQVQAKIILPVCEPEHILHA
jgi:hypothetical protein